MSDSPVLTLTQELISLESVTPEDAGCQDLFGQRLRSVGFDIETLTYGEVKNMWAVHGSGGPILAFAGHTDVVPPGPLSAWHNPPFEPAIRQGRLYGRGAADMKGSLAAMLIAAERFCSQHPTHFGRLAFLITSDEEGPAVDGTRKVMEELAAQGEKIRWAVVGEPSSTEQLGDVIKNGRRGSLSGELTIHGIQGHIAYPQQALNPIHLCCAPLDALINEVWDEGNRYFPATSFQISNINSGTGATNVIPGAANVLFNFRYSTETNADQLRARAETILQRFDIDYQLDWTLHGEPFLTPPGQLVNACQSALQQVLGRQAELQTTGGTSDGRFIAPTGAEVVELGPCNESIHKVNECVDVIALDQLADVYQHIMQNLLLNPKVA